MKAYKSTTAGGRFAALVIGTLCGVFAYARLEAGFAGYIELYAAIFCIGGIVGFFTNWQRVQ